MSELSSLLPMTDLAWQWPSVLLFTFQSSVIVMWRLQMEFLRMVMLPVMESPADTSAGLSSMKRVCFQCVGLKKESDLGNLGTSLR